MRIDALANACSIVPSTNCDNGDDVVAAAAADEIAGLLSKYALNATDDITCIKPPINTTRISIQKMHVVKRCADNFRPIDKITWLNMFAVVCLLCALPPFVSYNNLCIFLLKIAVHLPS